MERDQAVLKAELKVAEMKQEIRRKTAEHNLSTLAAERQNIIRSIAELVEASPFHATSTGSGIVEKTIALPFVRYDLDDDMRRTVYVVASVAKESPTATRCEAAKLEFFVQMPELENQYIDGRTVLNDGSRRVPAAPVATEDLTPVQTELGEDSIDYEAITLYCTIVNDENLRVARSLDLLLQPDVVSNL